MNRPVEAAPNHDKPQPTRPGVGTKRKSPAHCTPLRIHTGATFQRLGPLALASLSANTPVSKADPDAIIRTQTATLRRLRLADKAGLMEELDDSGCEMDEDGAENILLKKHRSYACLSKGKQKEEVAEAISPGGHITKRRARSRPVSAELQKQAASFRSPPRSPSQVRMPLLLHGRRSAHTAQKKPLHRGRGRLSNHLVAFPSTVSHRALHSPGSSSSEAGSPHPRRRITVGPSRPMAPPPLFGQPKLTRDVSAATLFFGPTIPQAQYPSSPTPDDSPTHTRSTNTQRSTHTDTRTTSNRHSFAGSTDSFWSQIRRPTSPLSFSPSKDGGFSDDEDMSFEGPAHSSFSSFTFGETKKPLPSKFSNGIDTSSLAPPVCRERLDSSSSEDNVVTPSFEAASWQEPKVFPNDSTADDDEDVDEFILRTLAAASKGPDPAAKKIPGTPVKKVRKAFLGPERPWQSAAVSKIGLKEDIDLRMAPRKSLPAAFPGFGTKGSGKSLSDSSDSEGEEDSPSGRKNGKYAPSLGLGHPSAFALPIEQANNVPPALPRSRWLMRRSSSGAFSTGSESASQANTPTRAKSTNGATGDSLPQYATNSWLLVLDFKLPKLNITEAYDRSASGSSTSTVTSSPTNVKQKSLGRHQAAGLPVAAPSATPASRRPRLSLVSFKEPNPDEQTGRFDRDFQLVDELGSGEFGKVMKVESKLPGDDDVYAIKKSKRFEGAKHR